MEDAAHFADLTLAEFEDRLASAEPVPGGGSASAVAGSMAASLLAMVSRLSADRPKYADFAATHTHALEVANSGRARLMQLADADAIAYAAFGAARKMPRNTDDDRRARDVASQAAARQATDVPLEVVRQCAQLMLAIEQMTGRSNLNAASDLEVAARLAGAAARGAAANVMINLPSVADEHYAGTTSYEVTQLLETVDRLSAQVSQRVAHGTLREPEQV